MTDKDRRIQTAINLALYRRNYRRVRDRALARLSNHYPETYKELLEQEKISDEQLGKKWIDIDGNTNDAMDFHTLSTGTDTGYYHAQVEANPGEDAGYDGGKA
jgi:hypothetical protein